MKANKSKIAIIGASSFQEPLIRAARDRGIETHVFAWAAGDPGELLADFFYPVSITEKETIASICAEIGIDGVVSIASDLANITVAYVAETLGLVANSIECVTRTTNKKTMNDALAAAACPVPRSALIEKDYDFYDAEFFNYPCIVKPVDRSGSRGITKLLSKDGLSEAVTRAQSESFARSAIIQEFMEGREFSVEYISWKGKHYFITVTEKITTGAPSFIEKGHFQPADITEAEEAKMRSVVEKALSALNVEYGASHSEVKIDPNGKVGIVEIGSRMGGDCIGSHLVKLSTGYDFVNAVLDVSLGMEPPQPNIKRRRASGVRFVFGEDDRNCLDAMQAENPHLLCYRSEMQDESHPIVDSGTRYGYFVFAGDTVEDIAAYLPSEKA